MRAGSLNKKIIFLNKVETKDSIGSLKKSLEPIFDKKVPASIREVQTTEKYFDSSVLSKTELIITVRYSASINQNLIVEYNGKKYDIVKINNIYGENKQLLIAVKGFENG